MDKEQIRLKKFSITMRHANDVAYELVHNDHKQSNGHTGENKRKYPQQSYGHGEETMRKDQQQSNGHTEKKLRKDQQQSNGHTEKKLRKDQQFNGHAGKKLRKDQQQSNGHTEKKVRKDQQQSNGHTENKLRKDQQFNGHAGKKLRKDQQQSNGHTEKKLRKDQQQSNGHTEKKLRKDQQQSNGHTEKKVRKDQQQSNGHIEEKEYFKSRSRIVTSLKENDGNPYPHKFHVSMSLEEFVTKYENKTTASVFDEVVSVAGRLYGRSDRERDVLFYDLRGEGVKIEIVADAKNFKSSEEFKAISEKLRRGDIIGVIGKPDKTEPGALGIIASSMILLSPCLHELPHSFQEINDTDTRFRQRYLDLIINEHARKTFVTRAQVIAYIRNFLDKMGFLEVETPVLNTIPGGASAIPFTTFHNYLKSKQFLRISPEIYLKMLIVGGLDKVYEIGKQFRNEENDGTHCSEFTSCECYMAYKDYEDLMNITEHLVSGMVKQITGGYKVMYHPEGPEGPEWEVDYTPPFKRVDMTKELENKLGVKFPDPVHFHSEESRNFFNKLCTEHGVECTSPKTSARLLDKLVKKYIEEQCVNPTFIMNHPEIMSPLAKWHRSVPGLTERFELFVCQMEICDANTDVNDPFELRERFAEQAKERTLGDEQAMFYDEGFCKSLEYGLAPMTGWGMGIDRLCMFLMDSNNIKEVILFPSMKPDNADIGMFNGTK